MNQTAGPNRPPGVDEAFQLQPYAFVEHPLFGSSLFWQDSCLDYLPRQGEPVRIWLANVPANTWVDLVDGSGRRLPVSVFWDYRGALFAKWLAAEQGGEPSAGSLPLQPAGSQLNLASLSVLGASSDNALGRLNQAFARQDQDIERLAHSGDPEKIALAARLKSDLDQHRLAILGDLLDKKQKSSLGIWGK